VDWQIRTHAVPSVESPKVLRGKSVIAGAKPADRLRHEAAAMTNGLRRSHTRREAGKFAKLLRAARTLLVGGCTPL